MTCLKHVWRKSRNTSNGLKGEATMKTAHLSALIAGFLLIGPVAAQVASYDCDKAVTPTERAICASPSLGRKDVIVASYYDLLLHLKPAVPGMAYREFNDALRDQQRQFLSMRDACGAKTSCLEQRYDERIAALRETADRYAAVVFDRPAGK
jgi:uncharacterized protein